MEVLVASPVSWRNMNVPVAAMRSGAVGLLDLTFVKCPLTAANAARELTAAACGPYGLILHGRVGDVEEAALAAMGLADAPTMAGVGNGRARIGRSLPPHVASSRCSCHLRGRRPTGEASRIRFDRCERQ